MYDAVHSENVNTTLWTSENFWQLCDYTTVQIIGKTDAVLLFWP
jgi:hypothetical protein